MSSKEQPEIANPLAGGATPLSTLVEYQEQAIVSRTLVHKSAGTVTLFAFDSGQGLSEHTTPYDALVYVVEGKGKITVSGTAHMVRQGEVMMMPANHPHAVQALERFKMLLVMVR
ncbi:MAG: Cupin 2, conserved barrel domain protein [Dehalococcoidia bacterium]|nr:Cupin 2, conserved barrel domain protein [Dehalococcoidia bacterium]